MKRGRLSQFWRLTKGDMDCDGLSPTVTVLKESNGESNNTKNVHRQTKIYRETYTVAKKLGTKLRPFPGLNPS